MAQLIWFFFTKRCVKDTKQLQKKRERESERERKAITKKGEKSLPV